MADDLLRIPSMHTLRVSTQLGVPMLHIMVNLAEDMVPNQVMRLSTIPTLSIIRAPWEPEP